MMEITIIPVAHVSKKSVQKVRKAIADRKPDVVAVELDAGRLSAMLAKREPTWREMLSQPFGAALYLFQKAVGKMLNILPGSEMLAAVEAAHESRIPIALIDQEISVTMGRLRGIPLSEKISLASQVALTPLAFIPNPFARRKPLDIEEMSKAKNLGVFFKEFSRQLPNIYRVLVEERDEHMTSQILRMNAENVVVVVGAGHALGMARRICARGGERLGGLRFRVSKLPPGLAS